MPNLKHLPSVFDYLDYRRFLEDYFSTRKMSESRFSLRAFAKHVGLPMSNSSFFSKVIAGKRNLTMDLRFKLAKALKLAAGEMRYFELLVQFNQSKDAESKQHFYAEIAKYQKSPARVITQECFEYYSKWQNSVVRAFFGIQPQEKNAEVIGRKVFPQLNPREVEDAIRLMLQLQFITRTANGYSVNFPHIVLDRENKNFTGKVRIVEMLRLAQEVFPHVPAVDREFNSMTVYISKAGYQTLKERIHSFREDIKSLVEEDRNEDRIYTLNMQFFPNSNLPEWSRDSVPRKNP